MLSTVPIRAFARRAPHLSRSIVACTSTSADGGTGITMNPPLLKGSGSRLFHPAQPSRPTQSHQTHMFSSLVGSSNLRNVGVLMPSRTDQIQNTVRTNFSYAGPRKLSDILKTDLLDDKSSAEISDMWMTYHEGKENVHGLTVDEAKGKSILARAAQCPFFLHPIFREEGHFMILSQFQTPNHFLLAFLEDYRMDPARAQPLITISIFDDMAEKKGVALVRCDIINRGIEENEGYKICQALLEDYFDEEDFRSVHMFNKKPDAFDVDEFVKEKERRWKSDGNGGGDGKGNSAAQEIEAVASEK